MTHAEKVLDETSGEIEFNAAKKEQKVKPGILVFMFQFPKIFRNNCGEIFA